MTYALSAFAFIIVGMFLCLSAASMLGTYLKQRKYGEIYGRDESTYGREPDPTGGRGSDIKFRRS